MINKKNFLSIILFFTLLLGAATAQIKLTELPQTNAQKIEEQLFLSSRSRSIIDLSGGWKLTKADKPDKIVDIRVPFIFKGTTDVICQKEIRLEGFDAAKQKASILFLGVNYSADIALNDVVLEKYPGGEVPFEVSIPSEIIQLNDKNLLSVKIHFSPSPNITIPLDKGWQMPKNNGGITREVYLLYKPLISVKDIKFDLSCTPSDKSMSGKAEIRMINEIFERSDNEYDLRLRIIMPSSGEAIYSKTKKVILSTYQVSDELDLFIKSPKLWTPDTPDKYIVETSIFTNNSLMDEYLTETSFSDLNFNDGKVDLNCVEFSFIGTTYFSDDPVLENLFDYNKTYFDLQTIKKLGFNSVRFAKQAPHPAILKLCEELGLWAFVELPLNSAPEQIGNQSEFIQNVEHYSTCFAEYYSQFPAVAAIGLGSSYLPNSEAGKALIEKIGGMVKAVSDLPVYCSFIGIPSQDIKNVDLFGVEIYSQPPASIREEFGRNKSMFAPKILFISEATYPTYNGQTNGYANEFSYEAQAKYFLKMLSFQRDTKSPALFFNSMFDYTGEHTSFYTGYNDENSYPVGILPASRSTSRLTYQILKKKLINGENTTIPLGTPKDKSPLFFIIIGLALSIISGVIINARRQLREDASRALLRPYNFFADIRDHRILSGMLTNFLMLMLAGSHALLISNLLYFLRNNILVDKLLSSFGIAGLVNFVNYLAWNPWASFFYIFLFTILFFFLMTVIIKLFSLTITNRVYFSSIYYSVIWAFLPLALMLPVSIILYKVLAAEIINPFIYIFLGLMFIWQMQRCLKGVYVIFDVSPQRVYFYGFLFFLLTAAGAIFYFQFTESSIYYIINAIKQFQFI